MRLYVRHKLDTYMQQVRYAYVKACKHHRMGMYEKFNKYINFKHVTNTLQYVDIRYHMAKRSQNFVHAYKIFRVCRLIAYTLGRNSYVYVKVR